MEHILEIQQNYSVDDSIKSYEHYAYQPISGTQLNSPGEITIRIENQDAFFYPRKSWLELEGTLTKAAGTAYVDADLVTLVNNGPLFLFENIKYELSGQEIESVYHPGQATTILGLCKYSRPVMNQCWQLDTGTGAASVTANDGFTERHAYIIKSPNPKGSFRFCIPLDHVFGFCEDYDKIMYGFVHALTLVRGGSDDNAIFRLAAAGAGKVTLTSIKWQMPKIVPSDAENFRLYKIIESKTTIDVGFRMRQLTSVQLPVAKNFTWRLGIRSAPEKPRYIMIAFQTSLEGDQEKNTANYDHCDLTNIFVLLNNVRYPAIDFNANFTKNHYGNLYKNMAEFIERYYGLDPMVHAIQTDPVTYRTLFPIYVIDVSKQSERLQQGVVDITVEMSFEKNVTANTNAHALLISDRKLKFKSDGKKMNIIY